MQGLSHDPYPYYSPWHADSSLTLEKAYSFDPCAGILAECRNHVMLTAAAFLWYNPAIDT